jgi:hypothetical protein
VPAGLKVKIGDGGMFIAPVPVQKKPRKLHGGEVLEDFFRNVKCLVSSEAREFCTSFPQADSLNCGEV